jgi:hypothetical protein
MTLDASRETEAQDETICRFCGGELDLGYHYSCHVCGAAYCYIHMNRHRQAHSPRPTQPVPADAGTPAGPPATVVLTTDPEEIALIRTYMSRLLRTVGPSSGPQPLEGYKDYC